MASRETCTLASPPTHKKSFKPASFSCFQTIFWPAWKACPAAPRNHQYVNNKPFSYSCAVCECWHLIQPSGKKPFYFWRMAIIDIQCTLILLKLWALMMWLLAAHRHIAYNMNRSERTEPIPREKQESQQGFWWCYLSPRVCPQLPSCMNQYYPFLVGANWLLFITSNKKNPDLQRRKLWKNILIGYRDKKWDPLKVLRM